MPARITIKYTAAKPRRLTALAGPHQANGTTRGHAAPVFYPPCGTYHEMQGFPDQLLIGLVIATLPLSLAA